VPDMSKMKIKDYKMNETGMADSGQAVYEEDVFKKDVTTLRLLRIENHHIHEVDTYPIMNSKKIVLEFSENGKLFAIFMKMRNEIHIYNIEEDIETFFH
jgi:hypothetical protein